MITVKNKTKNRLGFTIVELVVVMAILAIILTQVFGVIGTVLKINRAILRDNVVETNMRNMVYNVSQILKTASVSFLVGPDKFDGKSDANGVATGLTKGWNYIGVSDNKKEFCLFRYVPSADGKSFHHQKYVLASSGSTNSADITYDFHVTGNEKERLLNFILKQNIKWEGDVLTKELDTSVFAMNSRNVNGSEGICVAFRNDPIEVERAAGAARFMLCIDVSGSMCYRMESSNSGSLDVNGYTGHRRNSYRIGVLEDAMVFLVDNLAKNPLISLGMTSYSNMTQRVYYPNEASGLGPMVPTEENPDTEEDPQADERYFTLVSKSKDDILNNYIKPGQAKYNSNSNRQRDFLYCYGGTNTGDSIRTGMAMLNKANKYGGEKVNHLILLTDGEPNIINYTMTTEPFSLDNTKLKNFFGRNKVKQLHDQGLNKFWILEYNYHGYACANRDYSKPYEGDIVDGAGKYYLRKYPPYRDAKKANMDFVKLSLKQSGVQFYVNYVQTRFDNIGKLIAIKNARNEAEYERAIKDDIYYYVDPIAGLMATYLYPDAFYVQDNGSNFIYRGYREGYDKYANWCSDVFLNKNKEKHVKKFHMIGFGNPHEVERKCKYVVNRINNKQAGTAKYYFGGDSNSLKKIFESIIKEINNDLWFIEGPQVIGGNSPTP